MAERRAITGWVLTQLLLVVTVVELAMYRLAVPALRPSGDTAPPGWHQALNYVGLFLFYFATALALGILFFRLARAVRRDELYAAVARYPLVLFGAVFVGFALINTVTVPTGGLSFSLELSFALALAALIVAQVTRAGDIGAKIGLALLCAPLLIHFVGVARAQLLVTDEVVFSGLPERVKSLGQWALVVAALVSPYCFSPRPFFRSAARVGPLVVGAFVGLIGALVLRQNYEVGMELAYRGLGIDIGPMAPTSMIALYLMALGALAWTLTACFTSESVARRQIGVGVGLVFVGGYAFAWPLQYVVSMVGLLTIGDAARTAPQQERGATSNQTRYKAPPISAEVWQSYLSAVVERLRALVGSDKPVTVVTVSPEDDVARSHIVAELDGVPVRLQIERDHGSIVAIDIGCGELGDGDADPEWTLFARSDDKRLGAHPEPPRCPARETPTGDAAFDARFRILDMAEHSQTFLDEDTRAKVSSLIDGWIAVWPDRGLRYRVHPGRGAPLDNPIPVTEMAFRGSVVPESPERMLAVLKLLVDMTRRVLPS